jgi:thiamine pyrophosphate-dependent acetolactate synthase large subunit-like protein
VARVQGGVLAARAIKAHGVDTVFTFSSGHLMPIRQGCRLEGVRVFDTRHAQVAAHAAEGWGRINRACGVAVVTADPGATGAVTAVANSIVIGDGGDVVAAVARVLRAHRPGHWLDPGPFACLGVGATYALGVKAAKPEKQVVVVVSGDGAFGLGFEYQTLVHLGLPAVFVIGNDAPTGYERLTETFGGHGEHVERPDQLVPALERALASGEPAIVNVFLDPPAMTGRTHSGI